MKLEPVTKIYKRNKKKNQKYLTMTSYCQILTVFLFLQFMTKLKQFRCRIPDVQSLNLKFSLVVIFYLTKTENRSKKSLKQLFLYCFE